MPGTYFPLTYSWTQIGGGLVTLSDSTAAQPTFTAPEQALAAMFQLTVTDSSGLSRSDWVAVNVVCNPTVTTTGASSITCTSALSGGDVGVICGVSIISRGICFSTSTNPTIANTKTINGSGIGSFTSSITGLSPGVTYYVRAYATNVAGQTGYGNEISFSTPFSSYLYVSGDGNCGTKNPCYSEIQNAINNAPDGAAILIKFGSYEESLNQEGNNKVVVKGGYDSTERDNREIIGDRLIMFNFK